MISRNGVEPDHRQYLPSRGQKQRSPDSSRPLSAREQLFGSNSYLDDENSPQLSPVYQSEAAREIIMEMSNISIRKNSNRRQIPREKRRHHTVSNIRHVTDNDSHFSRMVRLGLSFEFAAWVEDFYSKSLLGLTRNV